MGGGGNSYNNEEIKLEQLKIKYKGDDDLYN
jgi:hypothetical protein